MTSRKGQRQKIDTILSDVFNREEFERLERRLEEIMATITDLSNDVAALTAAVATLPTGSSLTAADQASLDASDAAVQAATAAVSAFVTPAPAEPAA